MPSKRKSLSGQGKTSEAADHPVGPGHPPVGRRFKPGQSGNPGGKPKGFGALIRQESKDGAELVRTALAILRNTKAANRDRLKAAEFLADRGWGKPPTSINFNPGDDSAMTFTLVLAAGESEA